MIELYIHLTYDFNSTAEKHKSFAGEVVQSHFAHKYILWSTDEK